MNKLLPDGIAAPRRTVLDLTYFDVAGTTLRFQY